MSLPEPLVECSATLAETLRGVNGEDDERGSRSIWESSGEQPGADAVASLVPLLKPIYKRPQGEMLQALCDSLLPFFISAHPSQGKVSELFSDLLTRKGVSVGLSLTLLVLINSRHASHTYFPL